MGTVERGAFRVGWGEATGAIADLGTFVPLVAALVLVNGLDGGSVLLMAGLVVIASGAIFRVPFPVQPLKALTAVAVALQLHPDVIHAAGIEIGFFLLLLSVDRLADVVSRAFTKPVVRSLQFGVGILLVRASYKLVVNPPAVFRGSPDAPWLAVLAVAGFVLIAWAVRKHAYVLALLALLAGLGAVASMAPPHLVAPSLHVPTLRWPDARHFGTAFVLLVIPQLPLTFGNAVVAITDVSHGYFGARAARVTPSRVCLSAGVANLASGFVGGMPMCHGAGGLTAHYRLGARRAGMNLLLGGSFVVLGLFFAAAVPEILGSLPLWLLASLLAYAGFRHALLVRDLRLKQMFVAIFAGGIGAVSGNLAITLVIALAVEHVSRFWLRRRIHTP